MRRCWVVFLLFFFVCVTVAQQRCTLSGYISDAKTGEVLIGASVLIDEKPGVAGVTNAYGYYSISLPAGKYGVTVRYMGYTTQTGTVDLQATAKMDFHLVEKPSDLKEVMVTARNENENLTTPRVGLQKLSIKEINTLPVIFGERDVLKTIQLLPGIKSAGEGGSGFNVRGGTTDQNLILLDEATVYNASHLMGFFSVFNSDAVKDVAVYKGNEPAEYGGRLASVLDIKMNDGNDKKMGVSGGIGLISSRINVEGPIVKNRGSFIVSARRTYADMFLKWSNDTSIRGTRLYFYDLNAKANYKINDRNRIYLSGYFGKDVLGYKSIFGIDWGNTTATLRLNHLFSDRLFSNTSLVFSNYQYNIMFDMSDGSNMNIVSRIQDYGLKQDFQYYMSEKSTFKFGLNSVYHRLIPGVITTGDKFDMESLSNKYAWENSVYFSGECKWNTKMNLEYGVRANVFSLLGKGNFYSYDVDGNAVDTLHVGSGRAVKTYFHVEPRVSIGYSLDASSTLKVSYARNTQNLHLLSNTTSGSPTDLWIPSSNNVKTQVSDQVAAGYYRNFGNNLYEFSVEAYYKDMQHQIDYKDGAELVFNESVESQIVFGKGRAYGLELFLKKRYGRLNGWVGYTLSRTERKFDAINQGRYYPARQDRTHDVSVVCMYKLDRLWMFSATWVYYTGNAVTYPCGKYEVDGRTMFYYTNRNADRLPPYHRLDIGLTYTASERSSWAFSLYNAYGHDNPYMINFRDNELDPTRTEAVQVTLFKYVPSVSYNFKF